MRGCPDPRERAKQRIDRQHGAVGARLYAQDAVGERHRSVPAERRKEHSVR